MKNGYLVLATGEVFAGKILGAPRADQVAAEGGPEGREKVVPVITVGEVVFNTSMSGYQEILTDPSYAGQILTFCYPLIGNYGWNGNDNESAGVYAAGVIMGESCAVPSHYQAQGALELFLEKAGIPALVGVDTRRLVRHIRTEGTVKGYMVLADQPEQALSVIGQQETQHGEDSGHLAAVDGHWVSRVSCRSISTYEPLEHTSATDLGPDTEHAAEDAAAPAFAVAAQAETAATATIEVNTAAAPVELVQDSVQDVDCIHQDCTHQESEYAQDSPLHNVLMDYGCKQSIIDHLRVRNCRVTVVPYDTSCQEVQNLAPDGVVFSNGPGDPQALRDRLADIREISTRFPSLGICLGHQLLALAWGGDTHKLPYGHRGANHSVKDVYSGKVWITSQNHGYVVSVGSMHETPLDLQ
jgi:carbamoyl-phosphate synthase small subunit